jgi:DNA-binding LacI/PurR family transcriptional regulator
MSRWRHSSSSIAKTQSSNHRQLKLRAIAVAEFDGVDVADKVSPPLTTVRVPRREMGKAAAETILERLNGHARGSRYIDLGYGLIERKSV